MTTRTLPRAEWPRLAGTELESALPYLPEDTQVLVVEDEGGRIVGCWAVVRVIHVEGVWVAPEYRRTGRVVRRLLTAMRAAATALGVRVVWSSALTPDVRDLLQRLGGKPMPGEHFALPVATRESCQQVS